MQGWGVKSFVDDLDTGQSVVFSRAATILRSIETKLLIGRFVHFFQKNFRGSFLQKATSGIARRQDLFYFKKNFRGSFL